MTGIRTSARRVLAAGAVAAGAAGSAFLLGTGSASAMPSDAGACHADQVTVTVVPQSPGAGQRGIELQFTAKNGQSCKLGGAQVISLTHAAGVKVHEAAGDPSARVTVAPGKPAHELLHWGAGEMADHAVTPRSLKVHLTGASDDVVSLPWKYGSVAAVPAADTVEVGVVQAGAATSE